MSVRFYVVSSIYSICYWSITGIVACFVRGKRGLKKNRDIGIVNWRIEGDNGRGLGVIRSLKHLPECYTDYFFISISFLLVLFLVALLIYPHVLHSILHIRQSPFAYCTFSFCLPAVWSINRFIYLFTVSLTTAIISSECFISFYTYRRYQA